VNVLLAEEPEIGLVDEGGCLKGVVLAFAAHVDVGETVELIVNERKKALESSLVSLAPIREELRNFT
jgi:hypothetical protein